MTLLETLLVIPLGLCCGLVMIQAGRVEVPAIFTHLSGNLACKMMNRSVCVYGDVVEG